MFGDVPCSNVMRSNCYIHSSLGGNSSQRFNGWPFARCQEARKNNPSSILKIPFILPIHLEKYYQNTGISNFKISGRTNTFEYLTSTVEKYMSQTFSGNLENLFMLPQNVLESSKNGITVEQLIKCGYFNKMLSTSKGCDYHCHECKYCDELYEKLNV